MAEIKEVTLPSGAILKINVAPMAPAKALFNACMKELKGVQVSNDTDIGIGFFKDLFCTAITSPEIEKAMVPCLKAALYNELPITNATFEPVEARQDYLQVMYEVANVNVAPFIPKDILQKLSASIPNLNTPAPK